MISNTTIIDLLNEQKAALDEGRTVDAKTIANVLLTTISPHGEMEKPKVAKAPKTAAMAVTAPKATTQPKDALHVEKEALKKLPKAVVIALAEGTSEENKVSKHLNVHSIPTNEDRVAAVNALCKALGTDDIDIPVDLLMDQPTDILRQTAKALGIDSPTLFHKRQRWQRFTKDDRRQIRSELLAA